MAVKYFLLALILIVTQPLPPIPRQTVNEQADKADAKGNITDKRQRPPDPSPSIVVMKNCDNESANANAAKNETSNLHPDSHKQPEPWSRSDKLTFAYDILTGLLVCIALGTGAAVAYQAIEMRRATNAMTAQLAATIRSERAWVVANLVQMSYPIKGGTGWAIKWEQGGSRLATEEEVLRGEHFIHRLSFTNMGRSAARITGYQIHYGFYDHQRGTLRVEHIRYNADFERMLGGGETTGIIPEVTVDIRDFVNNPAAGLSEWVYWMVVLVVVNYEHIFSSGGENEGDLFRFVFDPKTFTMKRSAVTEADKEQARNPKTWPRLGTEIPADGKQETEQQKPN